MALDVVGSLAVRDLPKDLAALHVDRADATVRRLQERQTSYAQSELRRAARRIVGRQHAALGRLELAAPSPSRGARAARRARTGDGVAFDVRHLGLAGVWRHDGLADDRRARRDVQNPRLGIER